MYKPIPTIMWTPPMYCVALKRLELLKYIIEVLQINPELTLKEPMWEREDDTKFLPDTKTWNSSLSLMIAVSNYDMPMLDYLWNNLYFLWDIDDLDRLIESLYKSEFLDALPVVLKGKAFKNILLSMSFED